MPSASKTQEFLSAKEQQRFMSIQEQRGQCAPELGDLKEMAPRTWRRRIPVWRDFEYWRLRADQYPHIERSDQDTNFFLRGTTCHPRLSDFPTCKDIISDYLVCRDSHPYLHGFNICAAMKEQMSACINEVFVKNSHRVSKKTGKTMEAMIDKRHEKRLQRMKTSADEIKDRREKFAD